MSDLEREGSNPEQPETRPVNQGSRVVVNTGEGHLYDGIIAEVGEVRTDAQGNQAYKLVDPGSGDYRWAGPRDILVEEPIKPGEPVPQGTKVVVDDPSTIYNGIRGTVQRSVPGGYTVEAGGDTRNIPTSALRRTYPATGSLPPKAPQR